MPLYTFECSKCDLEIDKVFSVDECPRTVKCEHCKGIANKILAIGHGGFQSTVPVWLDSACEVLQPDREPKLESRTEYNAYLKKKGLVACG